MAQCTHSTSPSRLELDKVVALTSHFLKNPEPRTMGYLTTVTNALGKSSQIVYNAAKQKIADVDARGNRNTYTHDNVGRGATVINARGYISTNTYNARSALVSVTDALAGVSEFFYDAIGSNEPAD